MWSDKAVIYQIHPIGFCGVPRGNDPVEGPEQDYGAPIRKVIDLIPHLQKLGVNTVLFNPLFESDSHGYNSRDLRRVDHRLGTNADFADVCKALHDAGMRVMLDAVFNHVGRGFFAFRDVLEKKWDSQYKDWFHISFDGNDAYNDGLWYEGWEGNYDLVKLNLRNEDVIRYLFESVESWIRDYDIDGLRLDVAYCLDRDFLKRFRGFVNGLGKEFFTFGEILGGDYKVIMNPEMLHSATNYECYKGLHSSFNSLNLFEIVHSLMRQFGSEPWCLYRGMNLISFADNHDVARVASILNNPAHLPLLYTMCFTMPGIPAVYYGSEWGMRGTKQEGDDALRPAVEKPEWNALTDVVSKLCEIRKNEDILAFGSFRSILLTNRQCIFERESESGRIMVAINADEAPFVAHFDARAGRAMDLLTDKVHDFGGGSELPPYSAAVWKVF